jgi:hypothetical protein
MQQAGAGAASDRRHDFAGAVVGIGHQAVGVSRIDKSLLDFGAVEFSARYKLMQAETGAVQSMIALASRGTRQVLDLAVESGSTVCSRRPSVR